MKTNWFKRVVCLAWAASWTFLANAQPVVAGEVDGDDYAWYFNKPAVSIEDYRADYDRCLKTVSKAHSADPKDNSYDGGLIKELFRMSLAPGQKNADLVNCMLVAGYRKIDVPSEKQYDFEKRLSLLSETELAGYIASDEVPLGRATKVWTNELFVSSPRTPMAVDELEYVEPNQYLREFPRAAAAAYLKRASSGLLKPDSKINRDLATLVFSFDFDGKPQRFESPNLVFVRRDPSTGNLPLEKNDPSLFRIANYSDDKLIAGHQVVQVPPGQYALWINRGFGGSDGLQIQFCLKTIAFEVVAGEAVYLGHWRALEERRLTVEVGDLDTAAKSLAQIDSQLSTTLRAAKFVNGATLPCAITPINSMYGLELPTKSALD